MVPGWKGSCLGPRRTLLADTACTCGGDRPRPAHLGSTHRTGTHSSVRRHVPRLRVSRSRGTLPPTWNHSQRIGTSPTGRLTTVGDELFFAASSVGPPVSPTAVRTLWSHGFQHLPRLDHPRFPSTLQPQNSLRLRRTTLAHRRYAEGRNPEERPDSLFSCLDSMSSRRRRAAARPQFQEEEQPYGVLTTGGLRRRVTRRDQPRNRAEELWPQSTAWATRRAPPPHLESSGSHPILFSKDRKHLLKSKKTWQLCLKSQLS